MPLLFFDFAKPLFFWLLTISVPKEGVFMVTFVAFQRTMGPPYPPIVEGAPALC